MAPPKKVDLTIKDRQIPIKKMLQDLKIQERHAELSKTAQKYSMAFPEIKGLKDAVSYQVNQTARGLNARVDFEKKKKEFKKNPIDPKTLKMDKDSFYKAMEKSFKKLAKFESDMVKVLGNMADLEKETVSLEKSAWKDLKKGDVEAVINENRKTGAALRKKMGKAGLDFRKAKICVEDCMKSIDMLLALAK